MLRIFHRHKFDLVNKYYATSTRGGDYTVVLSQCSCGKRNYEALQGVWPLEGIV